MTSLAPVLSATSSRVCIWIMGRSRSRSRWARSRGLRGARHAGRPGEVACDEDGPHGGPYGDRSGLGRLRLLLRGGLALAGQGLLGAGADDADDPPSLELREGPRLHDLDDVAEVGRVGLVVGVADRAPLEELAVLRVRDQPLELDAAGLVHLVRRHDADLRLATGTRGRLGAGGGRWAHRVSITSGIGSIRGLYGVATDAARSISRWRRIVLT